MRGERHGKGGFILAYLCPALGPGGACSAQGHHGAAEDESGLMWHRLGHHQEVYLCCLFPPGSQAKGEPVGAMAPSCPDISTWAKSFLFHCTILQIWAPPQACIRRDGLAAQMSRVFLMWPPVVSLLGNRGVREYPDRDALSLAPHQLPLWNGLHPRLHSVSRVGHDHQGESFLRWPA